MITTVTTTTVTTVTVIAAMGLVGVVTAAICCILVAFLTAKELVNSTSSPVSISIGKHLSVPIAPMLMVFVVIVFVKVAEILA